MQRILQASSWPPGMHAYNALIHINTYGYVHIDTKQYMHNDIYTYIHVGVYTHIGVCTHIEIYIYTPTFVLAHTCCGDRLSAAASCFHAVLVGLEMHT